MSDHSPDFMPADMPLTAREKAMLDFERSWWKYRGAKEQAIRDLFDMSATRYSQVLLELIDRPESLAYDGPLVKRLQRLRAERRGTHRGAPPTRSGRP